MGVGCVGGLALGGSHDKRTIKIEGSIGPNNSLAVTRCYAFGNPLYEILFCKLRLRCILVALL